MSFSSEQKAQIIESVIKESCCRRCFIQGILAAKGKADGKSVEISVDKQENAEFIAGLIEEIYSKRPKIFTAQNGGRRRLMRFESPSAVKYITSFLGGGKPFAKQCEQCRSHFLRGLFFASGRLSDPSKQFLLEFSVGDRAEQISAFFVECGVTPRISNKANEIIVYFKRGEDLEDVLALAGLNSAAFAVMNTIIKNQLRNNVNRITNCTTGNISKAVLASMKQIVLIEELIKKGLISQLPDELAATARLRLEHRDLSLSQLAALTTPRISKPGLSHRLKRITEMAESLLEGKTESI